MDNKKQTNRLINAIGTTAESSLVFYRAAINAGAGAKRSRPAARGEAGMTLNEIIGILEDQAKNRDIFADKDDPDCIFRRDAKALREAISLLEKLTGEVAAAKRDIAALLWLDGQCQYCGHGQKVSYSGAARWTCKLGGAAECHPEWRGRCPT